ncbi:MAG: DUF61 family protein [Candidatus Odinarchaeota archaeon]
MENQRYDRILTTLWKNDIKNINEHLPQNQKYFTELIREKDPSVKSRSGDKIIFDKNDLLNLDKILDEEEKNTLKLPIILIRRIDLGTGVYSVSGGGVEIHVLNKMLKDVGEHYMLEGQRPYLYKPSVYSLKRKYRTCIVLGFGGLPTSEI